MAETKTKQKAAAASPPKAAKPKAPRPEVDPAHCFHIHKDRRGVKTVHPQKQGQRCVERLQLKLEHDVPMKNYDTIKSMVADWQALRGWIWQADELPILLELTTPGVPTSGALHAVRTTLERDGIGVAHVHAVRG